MEIESPGRLPHPVTLENMRKTRCSRNPLITRVLTELKWVRELNEGVPRIYADMEGAFLDDPEFTEGAASFKLILKNNIHTRRMRREDSVAKSVGDDVWNILDDVEKDILVYLAGHRDEMASTCVPKNSFRLCKGLMLIALKFSRKRKPPHCIAEKTLGPVFANPSR